MGCRSFGSGDRRLGERYARLADKRDKRSARNSTISSVPGHDDEG
jgi:hypothetical protein